jgi:hypothetical protein
MSLDAERFFEVIAREYIRTGKAVTAQKAGEIAGINEVKARKLLNADARIVKDRDTITVYSRSYTMMEHGVVRVWVYEPSKDWLRNRLAALCAS